MPFDFNLQRFADGDASAAEAAGASPATGAPTTPAEPSEGAQDAPQAQPAAPQAQPDVAVQVDPETGRRVLVSHNGEAQDAQDAGGEAQPAVPQPYTADELIRAMTVGQVDEGRIPETLKANYVAILQQQQLAAMQAQQQAQMQAQMQQAAGQAHRPPQPPQQSMEQAYAQMQEVAEAKALHDLGLSSKEELEGLAYSDDENDQRKAELYKVAVQSNINLLAQKVQEYQSQAQQEMAENARVMQEEVIPRYQQYVREEPNFQQIDVMMGDFYKQLPYAEAITVKAAIDRFTSGKCSKADIPILENYYRKTREAYYAQATGVPLTPKAAPRANPPRVESAGQVASAPQKEVDWRSMRNMDARERSEFLRANLKH